MAKLTPEARTRILQALGLGNYRKDAADFAGVAPSTLWRWLARGLEEPDSEYGTFRAEVLEAESRAKIAAMGCIQKAARDGDWKAAAWLLERRYPHQFSERSQLFLIAQAMEQIEAAAEAAGAPLPEGVWQSARTSLARDLALRLPEAVGAGRGLGAGSGDEGLDDVDLGEEEKEVLRRLVRRARAEEAR